MYDSLFFEVLGVEPRVSSMPGKCFTSKLKPCKGILEFKNSWDFGSSKYVVIIFINELYFEAETTA